MHVCKGVPRIFFYFGEGAKRSGTEIFLGFCPPPLSPSLKAKKTEKNIEKIGRWKQRGKRRLLKKSFNFFGGGVAYIRMSGPVTWYERGSICNGGVCVVNDPKWTRQLNNSVTSILPRDYSTECTKIYRKSVLHLLKYTLNLYRCSTDLR